MKQLFETLSRSSDVSQYVLLPSDSPPPVRKSELHRSNKCPVSGVPEGHLPVYVGEEMERFIISSDTLHHPVFVQLLQRSFDEYGYEQKGVLRIPCKVVIFERLLQFVSKTDGQEQINVHELLQIFDE